jgi:GNAT superfamily N-acetyltransferase
MHIVRWDPDDPEALRYCHEVERAAQRADDPSGPPMTPRELRVFLSEGWEANPCEAWHGSPGNGRTDRTASGLYWMEVPDQENRDRARLLLLVHPACGGRGVERALLRHAAGRARANGRAVLSLLARQGSPVAAFLRSAGATPTLTEVRRVLDLRTAPPGHFTTLRETAAAKAAGYSLVSWLGVTPEPHLAGVAQLLNAMNDAPREAEGTQEAVWDAGRVRQRHDSSMVKMGTRGYSVAAVHDVTGEMTAFTQLEVNPEIPEWGHQGPTAVTRPHRGHRLGLLVKATMLEWLATAEPAVERILTGNADSNQHMIAVNEALGYDVLAPPWQWFELPVAAVPGEPGELRRVPGLTGPAPASDPQARTQARPHGAGLGPGLTGPSRPRHWPHRPGPGPGLTGPGGRPPPRPHWAGLRPGPSPTGRVRIMHFCGLYAFASAKGFPVTKAFPRDSG